MEKIEFRIDAYSLVPKNGERIWIQRAKKDNLLDIQKLLIKKIMTDISVEMLFSMITML